MNEFSLELLDSPMTTQFCPLQYGLFVLINSWLFWRLCVKMVINELS